MFQLSAGDNHVENFVQSVRSMSPVPNQFHHFSFSHQTKGVVMATTHAEGPTQILHPHAPPP